MYSSKFLYESLTHCLSENRLISNDVGILDIFCLDRLTFNNAACKSNSVTKQQQQQQKSQT